MKFCFLKINWTLILQIEYDIKESATGVDNNDYTSTKRSRVNFPVAGDFIYGGVAHQHSGGTGAALYGKENIQFSEAGLSSFRGCLDVW